MVNPDDFSRLFNMNRSRQRVAIVSKCEKRPPGEGDAFRASPYEDYSSSLTMKTEPAL